MVPAERVLKVLGVEFKTTHLTTLAASGLKFATGIPPPTV